MAADFRIDDIQRKTTSPNGRKTSRCHLRRHCPWRRHVVDGIDVESKAVVVHSIPCCSDGGRVGGACSWQWAKKEMYPCQRSFPCSCAFAIENPCGAKPSRPHARSSSSRRRYSKRIRRRRTMATYAVDAITWKDRRHCRSHPSARALPPQCHRTTTREVTIVLMTILPSLPASQSRNCQNFPCDVGPLQWDHHLPLRFYSKKIDRVSRAEEKGRAFGRCHCGRYSRQPGCLTRVFSTSS